MKKLTEWLDEQPDYGLCNPPMDPSQALYFLFDYLIPGEYDPLSEGARQTNTYIVFHILRKYSKTFRKELRDRAKKCHKKKRKEKYYGYFVFRK